MMKCDPRAKAQCPYRNTCQYFEEGSECDEFNQRILAPQPTNADHIRDMRDEELAESRVVEIKDFNFFPLWMAMDDVRQRRYLSKSMAVEVELNWLRQPWEEEHHE